MNQFGTNFRISLYGESHGDEIGVIIDGVKPGIIYNEIELIREIEKRKPNSNFSTERKEKDYPIIKSGIFNNMTTGTPICISFKNEDKKSSDYFKTNDIFRPSHSDFVANKKYNGYNDYRGSGHFSGRLTLLLVAAGFFAKKMIPFEFESKILQIGKETNNFDEYLKQIKNEEDSIGGIIEVRVKEMIVGLGEPFFDSTESVLSHLLFSIPGIKSVSFGNCNVSLKGSEFNDSIISEDGKTKTNNNGGINGGITNGNDLIVKVFVKPTPSIKKEQTTFNFKNKEMDTLRIEGRHDECFALRLPIVVENTIAIGLADLFVRK